MKYGSDQVADALKLISSSKEVEGLQVSMPNYARQKQDEVGKWRYNFLA